MVRIAKVKLVGSRKTFEYLCPDTNIDEGDVVYLEDQESPSYVCEIVEVKDEKCKATKKVLSKAIRNDNVTLSFRIALDNTYFVARLSLSATFFISTI